MRWIGLDYGDARIGVALGDDDTRIASPWETLTNTHDEALFDTIQSLMKREGAEGIIVGVPRLLKDTSQQTMQQQIIREFIQALKARQITVQEVDETFSSYTAAQQQRELGKKGKRDDLAATVILQQYFDRLP